MLVLREDVSSELHSVIPPLFLFLGQVGSMIKRFFDASDNGEAEEVKNMLAQDRSVIQAKDPNNFGMCVNVFFYSPPLRVTPELCLSCVFIIYICVCANINLCMCVCPLQAAAHFLLMFHLSLCLFLSRSLSLFLSSLSVFLSIFLFFSPSTVCVCMFMTQSL